MFHSLRSLNRYLDRSLNPSYNPPHGSAQSARLTPKVHHVGLKMASKPIFTGFFGGRPGGMRGAVGRIIGGVEEGDFRKESKDFWMRISYAVPRRAADRFAHSAWPSKRWKEIEGSNNHRKHASKSQKIHPKLPPGPSKCNPNTPRRSGKAAQRAT